MRKNILSAVALSFWTTACSVLPLVADETFLLEGWRFHRGAAPGAEAVGFDDASWTHVRIPHDWAIAGPFDKNIDRQVVAIIQDGEKKATEKTGRTGSLPWLGEGWYRRTLEIPAGCGYASLVFDGAMSEAHVYCDGREVGFWPNGYNSFEIPLPAVPGRHEIAVHLFNRPESSRWYPGAGLYRPVRLVTGGAVGIRTWGVFIRTESLTAESARIRVSVEQRGTAKETDGVQVVRTVLDASGAVVASGLNETLVIPSPKPWTPETPVLYTLVTELRAHGRVLETRRDRFGLRTVSVSKDGFRLNGKKCLFKGVCLHHDLGPIGAAFNKDAFRRQVRLLKTMGCNAIRTAHNMPAPWQMDICDELGMMVMAESFDMWAEPKCKNGYAIFFKEWHLRDLENLIRCHRNHPSVVMWSIGNEVPEQGTSAGFALAKEMQDFCHRMDPTRPVTQGIDRPVPALASGVLGLMDVPGLNYRLPFYEKVFAETRQGLVLGSETASTVSSRGVYKFPVKKRQGAMYSDGQCSGYDVECCPWSNLPDEDWAMQDDHAWTVGEFVWTGFDYLGEPTPYNEYWPSRSSYFGIFDLAGLPKDRYWLYRSRWNTSAETIHLVPHWTWPGREGKVVPVYCYTSYPAAELFVNGKSQGRRTKNTASCPDRYRLRWNDVVYEPGELKVVAFDANGKPAGEHVVRTAGVPARLAVSVDRSRLAKTQPDSSPDLAFVTVRVVDKDGNLCPDAAPRVSFAASGAVRYTAACNGDATSLESFIKPSMKAFHGELIAIVEAGSAEGIGVLRVSVSGMPKTDVSFTVH